MPSEPRLIRGPCFDCDEPCDCAQYAWMCSCHFRNGDQTEPVPKLTEDLRPNVPPRMMS